MMIYDQDYVAAFRKLAVTDTLIVGETYYSNSYPEQFTVKRLLTNTEHYKKCGLVWTHQNGDEIGWFEIENGRSYSLRDCNINASYNPWLIFKTQTLRDSYASGLVVGYEDDSLDYFDNVDDYYYEVLED